MREVWLGIALLALALAGWLVSGGERLTDLAGPGAATTALPSRTDAQPEGGGERGPRVRDGRPCAVRNPTVEDVSEAGGPYGGALRAAILDGFASLRTRLSRETLLQHPLRRRIYELIREEDPPTTMDIVGRVAASRSTVRHHLAKLAEAELVAAVEVCQEKRWFQRTTGTPEQLRARAALAVGNAREVYDAVCSNPGSSLTAIASRLDMDPSTTHRIMDRLVDVGLVERERHGRETEHWPIQL